MVSADNILELRQYTLRGGRWDSFALLFEQNFVDPQNALGAHIVGTFRDLDDPDRFVWIRGFEDMATRRTALNAFYGGAVWHANRTAANAFIVDSDNVLLMRPASPGAGFPASPPDAPAGGGLISALIYYLGRVDSAQFASAFEEIVLPRLVELGAQPMARLVTEDAPNNFPLLPIREGEQTFTLFVRWRDATEEEKFVKKLRGLSGWRDSIPEALLPAFMRKPERLRLVPTRRSALR